MVCEFYQSKDVDVNHIPGIINTSDIFTKKMKYNTHFRNLRDSMMVSLQAFLKYSHNVPSHNISAENNSSLLFHTAITHSSKQSRTQNMCYRTRHPNHSGTSIGRQTDRIKRSSLHFFQHGGVDGSRVNGS